MEIHSFTHSRILLGSVVSPTPTTYPGKTQQTLKGLVKAREPLKARALCLGLLQDAEARKEPYSVHSYLTLMKNLGRAGDWEGAMGVFEALRGRHEGVGGKEYMKVRASAGVICMCM